MHLDERQVVICWKQGNVLKAGRSTDLDAGAPVALDGKVTVGGGTVVFEHLGDAVAAFLGAVLLSDLVDGDTANLGAELTAAPGVGETDQDLGVHLDAGKAVHLDTGATLGLDTALAGRGVEASVGAGAGVLADLGDGVMARLDTEVVVYLAAEPTAYLDGGVPAGPHDRATAELSAGHSTVLDAGSCAQKGFGTLAATDLVEGT